MNLGERVRRLRLAGGLTQAGLAEPEYTAAYVSTIEAGKRQPSRTALEFFARRLNVATEELLTGKSPALKSQLLADCVEARKVLASGIQGAARGALKVFRRITRDARGEDLPSILAKSRLGEALATEAQNQGDEALQIYADLEHELQQESVVLRVDAIVGRARLLQTRGDVAHAAFVLEKALAELEAEGLEDPSSLVRLHTSLVAAYFDKGLIDLANRSAEIALGLSATVTDPERLANLYLNAGILLKNQRKWDEAESRLADAERLFGEIGYVTDLARVRLTRGMALRDQGDFERAREHLLRASEMFREAGNGINEARALGALAISERKAGRLDEARFLLKRSLSLSGEDSGTEGIAYRELGLCDAAQQKPTAVTQIRRAIELLEKAGNVRELATTYRELGNVLSGHRDLETACDAYRTAADLFERAA